MVVAHVRASWMHMWHASDQSCDTGGLQVLVQQQQKHSCSDSEPGITIKWLTTNLEPCRWIILCWNIIQSLFLSSVATLGTCCGWTIYACTIRTIAHWRAISLCPWSLRWLIVLSWKLEIHDLACPFWNSWIPEESRQLQLLPGIFGASILPRFQVSRIIFSSFRARFWKICDRASLQSYIWESGSKFGARRDASKQGLASAAISKSQHIFHT